MDITRRPVGFGSTLRPNTNTCTTQILGNATRPKGERRVCCCDYDYCNRVKLSVVIGDQIKGKISQDSRVFPLDRPTTSTTSFSQDDPATSYTVDMTSSPSYDETDCRLPATPLWLMVVLVIVTLLVQLTAVVVGGLTIRRLVKTTVNQAAAMAAEEAKAATTASERRPAANADDDEVRTAVSPEI